MTDPLLDTAPMRPVRPGRRPSGRHPAVPPSKGLTIGAALGLWLTSFLLGSAIGAFTRDDDRTGTDTVDRPEPVAAELAPPEEPDAGSSDEPAGVTDQSESGADGPAVGVATSTPTAAQPQPPARGHGPGEPAGDGGPPSGPGSGGGSPEEEAPPTTDPPATTTTTAPPTTAPPTTGTTTTTAPAGPSGPAEGDTVSITPLPG